MSSFNNYSEKETEKETKKETEKETKKETIKVFVITGPETSGIVTYEKDVNGKKEYSGMAWDIVEELKKLPSFEKYNFEYTFSKSGYNNYNETVDWVSNGTYDLGLATYMQNTERESKINYSVPITIDAYAVYHYKNTSEFNLFKRVFYDVGYLLLILIVLGIIAGLFLLLIDPGRNKIKQTKSLFLRSVMTGISSFSGTRGALFGNATASLKGLVSVVFVMIFSLIFIQFMQAEITSTLIEEKQGAGISDDDIKMKPVLGHEGYAHTTKWEENGGKVTRHKGKSNEDLLNIYKSDPDKHIGVVLSYYDGYPFLDLHPEITASVFGNSPSCMIYNPDKRNFGEDLNQGLLYIRSTKKLEKICKYYFSSEDSNAPPACTL